MRRKHNKRVRYRSVRRRLRFYVVRTCRRCEGQETLGEFPRRSLAVRFLKVVPRRYGFTFTITSNVEY